MNRKPITQKIMFLGIDGMDPHQTMKYLRRGVMPNMEEYMRRGACREDLVMLGAQPTITPPISPGPAEAATASRSEKPMFALERASVTMDVIFSKWARAAISGTTPPNETCSGWEKTTEDSRFLFSSTTAAAVSSQLDSIPKTSILFP